MIAYPVVFYIPFVLVSVFSVGIAIKIFIIKKNRAAIKGKIIASFSIFSWDVSMGFSLGLQTQSYSIILLNLNTKSDNL